MAVNSYKELLEQKEQEFKQLNEQFIEYQEQSDLIITDLQSEIKQLRKKNQGLNRQINQHKEKRKSYINTIQREMQQTKKEREQFKSKFQDFEKKVIELENINENLQSDLRATKAVLNQYEQKTQKYMQELAVLQIQLEQTHETSQQQIARLRTQLKQTQEQLYAFHHAKQKNSMENLDTPEHNDKQSSIHSDHNLPNPNKMLMSKGKRNPLFAETLSQIRGFISSLSTKRQQFTNKIDQLITQ